METVYDLSDSSKYNLFYKYNILNKGEEPLKEISRKEAENFLKTELENVKVFSNSTDLEESAKFRTSQFLKLKKL